MNFSSICAGLLDERDSWRVLQRWFIDHFCKPLFDKWLRMALLTVLSDISLSPHQMRMFTWRARGWDWVDPLKDGQASVLECRNGLEALTQQLAERATTSKKPWTSSQWSMEARILPCGSLLRSSQSSFPVS